MRDMQDLSSYKLSAAGVEHLWRCSFHPVESLLPCSASNMRCVLLELVDDVVDGGCAERERFFGWFTVRPPEYALKATVRELRIRGLLESFAHV